jgi:glutathione S-transferase
MLLIGQYDSPFVRRVAIAMRIYGIAFEHEPWSSFGDADKIRAYNPLTRVPTLVLDSGEVLIESHAMLDYLDGLMPQARRLFPVSGADRYRAIKIAALACGAGDKGVSLFYELRLHEHRSQLWVDRCRAQISGALHELEHSRSQLATPWWFGENFGHADIAVACVWRLLGEAHRGLVDPSAYPALQAHCANLEATPVFQEISQRFIAPA